MIRAVAMLLLCSDPAVFQESLQVGVTNHAYFSWVANLGQGLPVVAVPLVPLSSNLHDFEPRPEDLRALAALDLLVWNGLGHDAFVERMLTAASRTDLPRVDLHQGVPLIPYTRATVHRHEGEEDAGAILVINPHTYLSISTAIPQIYNLERALSSALPEHEEALRSNARRYVRRLRELQAAAAARLTSATPVRIATVHDAYAYLLQELGLSVSLVLQPRHGVEPSPQELAAASRRLKDEGIEVLFAEQDAPRAYVELLRGETGVRVLELTHLSRGEYTAERFEEGLRENLETIIQAIAGARAAEDSGQ